MLCLPPRRAHQPDELLINQFNVHTDTQAPAGVEVGRDGWHNTRLVIKQKGDVDAYSASFRVKALIRIPEDRRVFSLIPQRLV